MRKKTVYASVILFCLAPLLLSVLSGCGGRNKQNADQRQESSKTDDDPISGQEASSKTDDAAAAGECPDQIRKRGYLIAGCKTDVPGLSFYDSETDTWSGLEVELAWQTAAKLFEVSIDEAKQQQLVQFTGVTVADREKKLESKEVDCLFATYTITKERKEKFAFSDSYYTDYIGLMVRTFGEDPNSLGSREIRSIADLDGKKIGVAKNATTRKMFLDYIQTMNNIQTAPVFFEYKTYQALFSALKKGEIDVMAVDVSILRGYEDPSLKILNDRFGGQRYGVAVRKEDAGLLTYVNDALKQ